MANWEDRIEVKKGNFGEAIVRDYLEKNGWVVYEPKTNGPHAFDKMCIKDKQHIIIAEVKSKARMNKFNATGFDLRHYNEYQFIKNKYGIDVFCFFVDEALEGVYGNSLSVLEKPYTAKDGTYPKIFWDKIIIFSLEVMKPVCSLDEKQVEFLKEASRRNYEYNLQDGLDEKEKQV